MRIERLQCPHCQVSFKLSNGVTVGRSIACPRCRRPFVVTEPSAQVEAPTPEPDEGTEARPAPAVSTPRRARPSKPKRARSRVRGFRVAPGQFVIAILALAMITVCAVAIIRYQIRKATPGTAAGGDVGQAEQDADFRVQLFDPRATIEITNREIKAGPSATLTQRLLVCHYMVRYRIVAGQAAPNKKYLCDVSGGGTSVFHVLGKDMQPEGLIEGRSALLDQTGSHPPANATFKFMTNRGGPWLPISNTVTCSVKPYEGALAGTKKRQGKTAPPAPEGGEGMVVALEPGRLNTASLDDHLWFPYGRDWKTAKGTVNGQPFAIDAASEPANSKGSGFEFLRPPQIPAEASALAYKPATTGLYKFSITFTDEKKRAMHFDYKVQVKNRGDIDKRSSPAP